MLPAYIPFPDATIVASGVVEVTVGILLLYRRARCIAAAASVLLLMLYIPAVLHILQNDSALPFCKSSLLPNEFASLRGPFRLTQKNGLSLDCDPTAWPNRAWRILGVPHNVFMAICSIHLMGNPYPRPWPTVPSAPKDARTLPASRGGAVTIVAFILLLCNAAGFLAVLAGSQQKPTASMWMMMCLAVGALLGFLFAVPRLNTKTRDQATLLPNRNIEAISDWLTKILVGLGLVNLKEIGRFLITRSKELAPVFGTNADFILAFIIYFAIAGFLEGYLLTRMFLQWHFEGRLQSALSTSASDSSKI